MIVDLKSNSLCIEIDLANSLNSRTEICTRAENDLRLFEEGDVISTFGLLADVQYADHDDHTVFGKQRYYRNSLNLVREAMAHWKRANVKFVVQLGDLIDGKCKLNHDSAPSLRRTLDQFDQLSKDDKSDSNTNGVRLLHVWGNHEFYNFKRSDLVKSELNTAHTLAQNLDTNCNYYSYEATDFLKVICLDFYEFSMIGYETTDEKYIEASKYIEDLEHTKSEHYTAPHINGGIKGHQLKWLEDQLNMSRDCGQKVIVCGHNPIIKEASVEKHLALNAAHILALLWSYDDLVLAYLSGHYHAGGYVKDKCNIHHVTVPGIVEKMPGTNCFMTVQVRRDKITFYLNND